MEGGGNTDAFPVLGLTRVAINASPGAGEITFPFSLYFQLQPVYFLEKALLALIGGEGLATLDATSGTMSMFDPKPHRLMTMFGEACAAHKTGTLYRAHFAGILERPMMVHPRGSGEKSRTTGEIA